MDLNKVPRWALLVLIVALWWVSQFLGGRAIADVDKLKVVAYDARNMSIGNQEDIVDLKGSVEKIQVSQETFRKEYREDRIRDQESQRQMEDRIIRAVKG